MKSFYVVVFDATATNGIGTVSPKKFETREEAEEFARSQARSLVPKVVYVAKATVAFGLTEIKRTDLD